MFSMFSLMGIIYGCYHIFGNAFNKKFIEINIRGVDILDVDKAKIKLTNG